MEVFRGRSGGAQREEGCEEDRMKQQHTSGRVAAFFDLDGTLLARPSLERRFFAELRYQRAIPMENYFLWLGRVVWLAPRGMQMVRHANKMYLRGLPKDVRESHKGGQPPRHGSGQAKMAVLRFFPEGVDQVAWHARQGHAIVLVSGTLEPLAQEMALALVVRLAVRGITASVAVWAARVGKNDGGGAGRVFGGAGFGEGKAAAVAELARWKGVGL